MLAIVVRNIMRCYETNYGMEAISMNLPNRTTSGISLRQLFPNAKFVGPADLLVSSCCSDSRKCQPGDLFVSVTGSNNDGHEFAADAIHRGATAILCERLLPVDVPQCIVEDSREAYGHLCQALAGNPCQQLQVVGVSGTSGKTCVSVLLSAILEEAGAAVGVRSSLGSTNLGIRNQNDEPVSAEIARWIHRNAVAGNTHAVIEVSSRELAQRQYTGLGMDAVVLTNVKSANLDLHGSATNYRRAQAKIVQHLKPHGVLICNADDQGCRKIASRSDSPVLTYGISEPADVTARILERHLSEQTFMMIAGNDAVMIRTRIIGMQHVSSCLAAATTALVMGISLPDIAKGIESLDRIPGRMERLECGQDFGVFVDSANTPDTLANTLNTLRRVTHGRLICVFGPEGETASNDRALMGRVVERLAHIRIITTNNPRHESPLRIAHDVLDGFSNAAAARVIVNRETAIHWAIEQARPGDVVAIVGKGSSPVQVIGGQHTPWDDREIACHRLFQNNDEKLSLLRFPALEARKRA